MLSSPAPLRVCKCLHACKHSTACCCPVLPRLWLRPTLSCCARPCRPLHGPCGVEAVGALRNGEDFCCVHGYSCVPAVAAALRCHTGRRYVALHIKSSLRWRFGLHVLRATVLQYRFIAFRRRSGNPVVVALYMLPLACAHLFAGLLCAPVRWEYALRYLLHMSLPGGILMLLLPLKPLENPCFMSGARPGMPCTHLQLSGQPTASRHACTPRQLQHI